MSHDGLNATLPPDVAPEAVTLEQAVGLSETRAARGGGKATSAASRSTARKAPHKRKAASPPVAGTEKKPARKAKRG